MSANPTVQVKGLFGLILLVKFAMPRSKLVTSPTTQPLLGHFTVSHPTICVLACCARTATNTRAGVIDEDRMAALLGLYGIVVVGDEVLEFSRARIMYLHLEAPVCSTLRWHLARVV